MHTTTWFITGSSSGIGRRVTEHLLHDGHRVAATARKPEQLADLTERYSDQLWTAALDVTDPQAVRTTVDRAFAELGRIDVVFSNAGYGMVGAAEEFTDADIDRQFDTNLRGPIHLTRAVLPHLRAQGGGRIIQTSSMGGQVVYPGSSPYQARYSYSPDMPQGDNETTSLTLGSGGVAGFGLSDFVHQSTDHQAHAGRVGPRRSVMG